MTLRKAKKKDFESYLKLRTAATREYSKLIGKKLHIEPRNNVKRDFYKSLSSGKFVLLIFEDKGAIVAYLNGSFNGEKGIIDYLYVDKKYRGRGVAKSLINKFLSMLKSKKIKLCKLKVNVKNRLAIGLYKNLGFKVSSYEMNKKVGR